MIQWRNQKGSLLLEFSIYFLITALLAVGLAIFVGATYKALHAQHVKTHRVLERLFCLDTIYKKLQAAPRSKTMWHSMQEKELIWIEQKTAAGLVIENGTLFFVTGTYNPQEKRWQSKVKSTISTACEHINFGALYEGGGLIVQGVQIREHNGTNPHVHYVAIRG